MTLATIFAAVCWMSVAATIVAVPVMVLEIVFERARVPKKIACLLYALVLLRMICPVALPGDWGLFSLPLIQTVQQEIVDFSGYAGDYEVAIEGSAEYEAAIAAGLTPERAIEDSPQSLLYVPYRTDGSGAFLPAKTAMETWVSVLAAVWLAGGAVFYALTLLSYFLLRRRLRFAVKLSENVYVCECIPSPCVVGYFRPRIYLVPGLNEEEQAHILAHERAHLRAGDHWAKLIAWMALGVHWFNFYLWGVYRTYCSDLEQACDERVVRAADVEERKAYSRTLLHLSYNRRFTWLNPVAFAEGGTKERVTHVLRFRRATPALLAGAAAAAVALALLCSTGGARQPQENAVATVIDHTDTLSQQQIDALEGRSWALMGADTELEWVNTRSFSAMEILSVRVDGSVYTMEVLEGSALFSWMLHGTGRENGTAAWTFGIPMACRETLQWDGEAFSLINTEAVGETVQSGDRELDVSGFSQEAIQRMEETDAGLASVVKTLCRQAELWYGCRVYQPYVTELPYGDLWILPDGQWNFAALGENREGTFAPLRAAGQSPAGTPLENWSDEQLVWALPGAEGAFAQEVAAEVCTRFEETPKDILRELTALGTADRTEACWRLAQAWNTAHDTGEAMASAEVLRSCTPAVQDTVQLLETDRRAAAEGAQTPPQTQDSSDDGWAVQGPIVMEASYAEG